MYEHNSAIATMSLYNITIRGVIYDDIANIARLERDFAALPSSTKDILEVCQQVGVRVFVAVADDTIVGYVACVAGYRHIEITGLVVATEFRRAGIGTLLVDRVKDLASGGDVSGISIMVPDDCLPLHLFLRACRFYAHTVVPFKDAPDIYNFTYVDDETYVALLNSKHGE